MTHSGARRSRWNTATTGFPVRVRPSTRAPPLPASTARTTHSGARRPTNSSARAERATMVLAPSIAVAKAPPAKPCSASRRDSRAGATGALRAATALPSRTTGTTTAATGTPRTAPVRSPLTGGRQRRPEGALGVEALPEVGADEHHRGAQRLRRAPGVPVELGEGVEREAV